MSPESDGWDGQKLQRVAAKSSGSRLRNRLRLLYDGVATQKISHRPNC